MLNLYNVELQGVRSNGSTAPRTANYQVLANSAPDAFLAAIKRWTAEDRSDPEVSYVHLSRNNNEIIQVEGSVDLDSLVFDVAPEGTTPQESLEF